MRGTGGGGAQGSRLEGTGVVEGIGGHRGRIWTIHKTGIEGTGVASGQSTKPA